MERWPRKVAKKLWHVEPRRHERTCGPKMFLKFSH